VLSLFLSLGIARCGVFPSLYTSVSIRDNGTVTLANFRMSMVMLSYRRMTIHLLFPLESRCTSAQVRTFGTNVLGICQWGGHCGRAVFGRIRASLRAASLRLPRPMWSGKFVSYESQTDISWKSRRLFLFLKMYRHQFLMEEHMALPHMTGHDKSCRSCWS